MIVSSQHKYHCNSFCHHQYRVAEVARAALTERLGSSTKGRTPNIRYFVEKLSIVVIYELLKGFHRAFNESYPAFLELSTKAILLS